jgi:hypothetical protein
MGELTFAVYPSVGISDGSPDHGKRRSAGKEKREERECGIYGPGHRQCVSSKEVTI